MYLVGLKNKYLYVIDESNKTCIIKQFSAGIVRATGEAGSATIILYTREIGGAFNSQRVYEISTSSRIEETNIGGIVLPPKTDIKATIQVVSDNGTVADSEIEYFLIDR